MAIHTYLTLMDLFPLLLDISFHDLTALVWIQLKNKSQFYYQEHN